MSGNEVEEEVMDADEALFVARDVTYEKDIGMNLLDEAEAMVPIEAAELVHYRLVEVVPT